MIAFFGWSIRKIQVLEDRLFGGRVQRCSRIDLGIILEQEHLRLFVKVRRLLYESLRYSNDVEINT